VDGYSNAFLKAMDKALATLPRDRFTSAADWLAMLDGKPAGKGAGPSAGTSKATPKAAIAPKPKPETKSRARVLAAIGLAVPIIGGVFIMQSGSDDTSAAVATPTATAESTPASVDVAAAIPGLETAPELSAQEAPASDLTTLLNIEAAATAQPETAAPEAGAVANEDLSAALNLGAPAEVEAPIEAAVLAPELPDGIESFNLPQIKSAWTIDLNAVPADGIYAINGIALDAVGDVDTALHQIMQPDRSSDPPDVPARWRGF